jgi:predicted RNase H-like nuclease (RuvC/YqgF family)
MKEGETVETALYKFKVEAVGNEEAEKIIRETWTFEELLGNRRQMNQMLGHLQRQIDTLEKQNAKLQARVIDLKEDRCDFDCTRCSEGE